MEDVYNTLLKKGWTLGTPQLTVAMHGLIRLYHGGQVRLLKQFWSEGERDIVVSLVPNFNRALRQSLPETPFVTILTDLADYPPHFWMEQQQQYLICGTDESRGAGSGAGPCAGACVSRVRHDPAAEVL